MDVDLVEVCRRARESGRNGWPQGTAESWRRVFRAHPHESNAAIARRYGVDRNTVGKARVRVDAARPASPKMSRADSTDDRVRIVEALQRAKGIYKWSLREQWTICPGNPGRAISTHGRQLTLAEAGAIPRATRILVIKDERRYRTSWEVDGARINLAHMVLRAFDGPPRGIAARVRYDFTNEFGVSMALRNLRWQEDLEIERAKSLVQSLLCGFTWDEASSKMGTSTCVLGKAYRLSMRIVGREGRHSAASAKQALEVLSMKTDEAAQRRAWMVSSAIPWPARK